MELNALFSTRFKSSYLLLSHSSDEPTKRYSSVYNCCIGPSFKCPTRITTSTGVVPATAVGAVRNMGDVTVDYSPDDEDLDKAAAEASLESLMTCWLMAW